MQFDAILYHLIVAYFFRLLCIWCSTNRDFKIILLL